MAAALIMRVTGNVLRGQRFCTQPQHPITKMFGLLEHFRKCDVRASLGLPGPRGGRRWPRLVPQYDQFSSKSGLWEAISWPFFVVGNTEFQSPKQLVAKIPEDVLIGCWGYFLSAEQV